MIKLENISVMYPPDTRALRDVSLAVNKRECILIQGMSGSGKTTLCRIIAGIDAPNDGVIIVDGHTLHLKNSKERAFIRNRTIGYLPKSPALLDRLTILENTALPLVVREIELSKRDCIAREALRSVSLEHLAHAKPVSLSRFEAQLTSLARAVIAKPKILICDDITAGLSEKDGKRILDILSVMSKYGKSTLLYFTSETSVDMNFDKKYVINKGQLA